MSNQTYGQIPQNITYEIVYNTTILDETMRKYPDPLSIKYGNNKLQPYWTGYAYTLQSQLDQITVSKYTNITLTHSFQRMQELIKSNIPSSMYFEVIVSFSWTVLLVLATLLASNNRG